MAKKLNYEIGFTADTRQLQQAIDAAVKSLQKLGTNPAYGLTEELSQASKSALDLSNNLQKAINQNTGKLDLIDFEKNLKDSGKSLSQYAEELSRLGPIGQQAFLNVASAITQAELPLKRSNKLLSELWVTMKNTARWQLTSSALHGFVGALSTAYGYSKSLDHSLNNIRIVSGQSAEEMKEFAEQANNAAKALSTTTTDYTDAALIYYQQGLDEQQVQERTEATIKMANVTGESAQQVSDQMTAIWNNFEDGSQSLTYYADVITALGAATASSADEISAGLEKFAAIADNVGLSYEYATAALATVTAKTRQSADVVGTAYKTLFARIQGLQLGETLEDGTTLNKYSEALKTVGISIFEQNGELKAMDKILDEMGNKWSQLSKDQQVALAQTVAGVRQYNQLMALMSNWDYFQENLMVARNSEGELERQAEIYAESWEAARNRVKAAAEDIYDSIINPDLFIQLDNTIVPVLSTIANLIDGMGGLSGAISITAYAFTRLYSDKLSAGLVNMADNIRILAGAAQQSSREMQHIAASEAENLQISSIANKEEQVRLQLMRDEVTLRGQINQLEDVLTEKDRVRLSQQQGILNLFKDQYVELSKQQSAAERNVLRRETDDILTSSADDDWRQSIALRIDDWNNNHAANKAINLQFNTQDAEDVLQDLTKQLKNYTGQSAEMLRLRQAWSSLSDEQKANEQVLRDLINSTHLTKRAFSDLENADFTKLRKWFESLSAESVELGQKIRVLEGLLHDLGVDDASITRYIAELRELATATDSCRQAGEAYNQNLRETSESLNETSERTLGWADKIVRASNVLIQLTMSAQALQSLGSIITNEDISIVDKITQSLMALTMSLPLIVEHAPKIIMSTAAYKSLADAIYEVAIAEVNGAAASEAVNAGFIKRQIVLKAHNILLKKHTAAQIAAMTATQKFNAILLASSPYLLALAAAVTAVVVAYDHFTISAKEAKKEIEEVNQAYEEEVQKLNELNNSLKTTTNRIKELEEQGSLTLVEQEELEKLRRTEELLKAQLQIQESLNKETKKRQLRTLAKNTAYEISPLITSAPKKENVLEQHYTNKLSKFEKGTEEYAKALQNFEDFQSREQDKILEWAKENAEQLQSIEDNYATLATGVVNNEISAENADIDNYQDSLKKLRKIQYSEEEYLKFFIQPVLDSKAMNDSKEELIIALANEKKDLDKYLNKEVKNQLLLSGISIEDFISNLQSEMTDLKNFLQTSGLKDVQIFLDNLTAEDIHIMMSLDLQNFDNFSDFYQKYLEVKDGVSIPVMLESARDSALVALQSLSTGEFLTDEQILELQQKFAGIFDLSQLNDMSMYDQAKEIGEAWMNAAFPEDLLKLNQEKLASMKKELLALNGKIHRGTATDEEQIIQAKLALDVKEAEKKLEGISDFELDPLELEVIGIEGILAQMAAVEKAASLIGEGFKVEAENVQTLMKTMPELFEDAIVSAKDGSVQLSRAIVDAVAQAAGEEVAITRDSAIAKLQTRIEETNASIDAIKHLRDLSKQYSGETLTTEKINSKLTKTEKIAAAKAMVAARIQQAIDEKLESSSTAASAIYDQTQITDSSKVEGEAVSKNWAIAADKMVNSFGQAFESISNMQKIFSSGGQVTNPGIGTITYDTSGFQSGTSSYSQKNFEESEEIKQLRAAKAFAQNDFSMKDLNKDKQYNDEDFVHWIDAYKGFELAGFKVTQGDLLDGSFIDDYLIDGSGLKDFTNLDKEIEKTLNHYYSELGSFTYDLSRLYAGAAAPTNLKNAGNKDSGKSGGSSASKKKKEELKDEIERYHTINRILENQESLLSDLEKQAERTFGLDRLKLYEQELEEINRKAAYEQVKMAEAGKYIDEDLLQIQSVGLNVQIDDKTKEILNWKSIIQKTEDDYNKAIINATDEEKESIEKLYKMRTDAIKQYEESLDIYNEQQQKVRDALREARDAELRNTTYKLQVILNVKNMKDIARDFSKTIVESYGDALSHGRESSLIGKEAMEAERSLVEEYWQQQADLEKLLSTSDDLMSSTDIIAAMEELQENVVASGEALLEWIETVETMLPDAIDAARERFNLFTDQLEHNTSVLDTIKELLTLQGVSYKTMKGFNLLQTVSQEKLDVAVASAELQRGWFENARAELLKAQEELEKAQEGTQQYDVLKGNRDALLEEYNAAQEAMLSSAQEAMTIAREMFVTEIEKASYDFSQAISDGLGLDFLKERYDHLIEEEERYLDEVNTTYEQIKWNSKLQTAIDEAKSLASKNQLKELQAEFEQRKKNNEISQYDVDILNAKYEMIQKQIALEEAQNNKSQVRLVRNSQGNWDYQYTSDQNAIDQAQQEYADAANEYYNIAKDQVKDITQEIVDTWQECNEKIKEIYEDETLTVAEREERIAELRKFYNDKILFLEEQKNNALLDMSDAGGDTIKKYGNTYEDVLDLMEDGTSDFNEAFDEYLDNMESAWNDYNDTVGEVADSTGTNMEDLKDIIDDVSDSTDDCKEIGEELTETLWDQAEAIHNLSIEYANLTDEVMEAVRALSQLAQQQATTVEKESGVLKDESKTEYNATTDYAKLINEGLSTGALAVGDTLYKMLAEQRDAKIDDLGLSWTKTDELYKDKKGKEFSEEARADFIRKHMNEIVGFNTGGYTGEFTNSKLAFLHEKELILNQTDTENMLTAVNLVRSIGPTLFKQIETALDNSAIAGANLFNMKMSSAVTADSATSELVQHINVTAEFPNATDQNEIRDAILGLANYTSQMVNSR